MKLSKVFLRWYKSFNISYNHNSNDRRADTTTNERPWDYWLVNEKDKVLFPFIEISIEDDITTIVGANESGKSHLLSAISKVINDIGIPGDFNSQKASTDVYNQTDLCHYSTLLDKNLEIWPHIGLEFNRVSKDNLSEILKSCDITSNSSLTSDGEESNIRLFLIHESDEKVARLYIGRGNPIFLSLDQLSKVRQHLPRVRFINSQMPIADQVPLVSLLTAYGSEKFQKRTYFNDETAQQAANFLASLSLTTQTHFSADQLSKFQEVKETLAKKDNHPPVAQLELLLFRDVLGINCEVLEKLYEFEDKDRASAEALIATWNRELEQKLNLNRYWQQDSRFSLRINYKQKMLYFEITDKTGSIYTFKERSSGLRYFLSYFIQAKALELTQLKNNIVILMDEPDSYLSILGQRNLVSIFESLVSADTSKQNTQLIYTTHSPFLVHRNFPRRIRLVRKGDAEEGTQYIDQSIIRRFEPVRSALGIDLGQTLFMGTTNVILEGPIDQYFLTETIRAFSGGDGMTELLDLNSVTIVSAESAPGIEKLIAASHWSDEPIPTAIVLLDNDDGGKIARERLVGNPKYKCKKLVEPDFAIFISEIIQNFGTNQKIITIEDLIPSNLYVEAILNYFQHWYPLEENRLSELKQFLGATEYTKDGLVCGTQSAFNKAIDGYNQKYDKMGIMQEVIKLVNNKIKNIPLENDIQQLRKNILEVCRFLQKKIQLSEKFEGIRSGKQAVHRIIGDFFVKHKASATPYDILFLLERLESEVEYFGQDGKELMATLLSLKKEIQRIRDGGNNRVSGTDWQKWHDFIELIRRNPLGHFDISSVVIQVDNS